MGLEQSVIDGGKARDLLENPLVKNAFSRVSEYLEKQALACNPDDAAMTQRVVVSKQIFQAIKREIERVIEDGEIARIRIEEIEAKKGIRKFIR